MVIATHTTTLTHSLTHTIRFQINVANLHLENRINVMKLKRLDCQMDFQQGLEWMCST